MYCIYYIYLFICVSQFPFFLVLSTSNVSVKYLQFDIASINTRPWDDDDVNNNNNTTSNINIKNNNNNNKNGNSNSNSNNVSMILGDINNNNNNNNLISIVLIEKNANIAYVALQQQLQTTHKKQNTSTASTNDNIQNSTMMIMWLYLSRQNTDLEAGICSSLAVLFAIFFMCISLVDDDFFVLGQSDADIPDAKIYKNMEIIRVIFWLFAWTQVHVINAFVLTTSTGTRKNASYNNNNNLIINNGSPLLLAPQDLTISCIMHTAALWGACRTNIADKASVCHRAACIVLYMIWLLQATAHASSCGYLLIGGQTIMDFILVLGHMYDIHTTSMVVLNCRLFFVTYAATWVHIAAWLSSFEC